MKKDDFKRINNYLNIISLQLFKSKDIEDNYFNIVKSSNSYYKYFRNRYLKNDTYHIQIRENNIACYEVLKICREVLESLNQEYVKVFDEILNNGTFGFSENSYGDSQVNYEFINGILKNISIDIVRSHNYNDIDVIIHEFMHYISNIYSSNIVNRVIGEFISIYFELYTIEFVYNNYKVNIDELFYNKRIVNTYFRSCIINDLEILILLYKSFGKLNNYTYKDANKYFCKYTKKEYEHECKSLLNIINGINPSNILFVENAHYYYLATLLAYYFRKKVSVEKMVNFVKYIGLEENTNLDILELLNKYNLNVDSDIFDIFYESMDEYLDIFENKKKLGR